MKPACTQMRIYSKSEESRISVMNEVWRFKAMGISYSGGEHQI